ncbi:MAG: TldD/PmbA family protein [Spirochaetales bacterium]|nr:TldD/PmbA family protein [Spirochaetales bacterium]
MPECGSSRFLAEREARLKAAVDAAGQRFDYLSVLGTDSSGISFAATPRERRVADSRWSERGFVFRAQKDGRVVEYAASSLPDGDLAAFIAGKLEGLLASAPDARRYAPIPDEPAEASWRSSYGRDPFAEDPERVLGILEDARKAVAEASGEVVFSAARAEFMRVSKLFISARRTLSQSFVWGQAYLVGVARRGEATKTAHQSFSGLKGLELLDELGAKAASIAAEASALLGAGAIEPGEYEVILTPDIAGLLAHEAFGHGVEMDMFVKGRARAAEYLGKSVASSIVDMYDGARGVDECGTYLFDDEGVLATRTRVIDKGILAAGLSDLQSALALGSTPTGNGRREAFDHKAYARMTNTYFAPGEHRYEDMVASVRHGWLLEKMSSGMEDPKSWGIQLVVSLAREIRDGAFTGRVAGPVVCSGYVPDVLGAIDMVSSDFELSGSGYCGKGHKEFVKVSAGGPYLKTRMRLG